MKPVEYVSIGGYVFSLENDACEAAKQYLSELETFYSKVESGSEVMEGIEERMSELLLEQSIALHLLVGEDILHHSRIPSFFARRGFYAFFHQHLRY